MMAYDWLDLLNSVSKPAISALESGKLTCILSLMPELHLPTCRHDNTAYSLCRDCSSSVLSKRKLQCFLS